VKLAADTLVAVLFDQPNHGRTEGDVACCDVVHRDIVTRILPLNYIP